jgi:tetratricopeptide (TPR) repeat protein
MKSRHFVERSAAGCFLALACCSVMLAQEALTPTRKGLELMGQARYGEAEEFLHRPLEIAGPADSTAVYNLANLYHRQGRFLEAERLHRLALEQIERNQGPLDPEVAQSLNDLGALYRSVGRYSQAIEALERAVLILERNPPQKFACTVFNNLGTAYIDIGQYAKAESMICRALAVIEFGRYEDASDLGYTLSCLGRVHALRKNYVEAEAAYSKALAIFGATVGSRRPEYALAQTNLALVYERQQRSRKALPLFESAINILEGSYGRESPVLTSVLCGYAKAMRHIGRKSEARQIARRAKSMAGPRIGTVDVATLRHQRR